MDLKEYRRQGYKMIDYIANYLENVRHLRVYPDVKPGYMQALLPDHAPEDGENFDKIFKDFETIVMPGVCHWQSPHMHGYFPSLTSPASLLGDMLSDGLSCLGFTWAASPASTELEVIVMDWLAKLVGLPDFFLHSGPGKGGGVIQTTASEGTLIALLAARTRMFQYYKEKYNNVNERELNTRLVGYTSDQAHSSVEKAGLIGLVHMRYIGTKDDLSMDGEKLLEAIRKDREIGLIPFFVCASLGTTGAGCFDHLEEIGPICSKENLFMHVDAAYAGCAFVCPEFRFLMEGVEYADSFLFNPAKWLLVNFDCSCFWVKNSEYLHRTFNVNPLYLKHDNIGLAVDFNHWQISLSRRFRALKIWMTLRNFGAKGLQKHIRHGINLGKYLETLVLEDERFEIPATRYMGLLVFRIKGENELTEALLKKINVGGRIHCVPYSVKGKYVIRFVITSPETTYQDIKDDWGFIQKKCNQLLNGPSSGRRLSEAEIKEKNPCFGTSLLLSDSPFSPKVINASFVALLEAGDTLKEFLDKNGVLSIACKDSPYLQRRLKDLVRGERKYSLDSHIDLIVAVNSSKEKKKTIKNGTDSTEEDSEEVPNKNCCRMCGQMIPYHMQNHIESVS